MSINNGASHWNHIRKSEETIKKELIDKACEWLEMHIDYWIYEDGYIDITSMLKDFRKAMEE